MLSLSLFKKRSDRRFVFELKLRSVSLALEFCFDEITWFTWKELILQQINPILSSLFPPMRFISVWFADLQKQKWKTQSLCQWSHSSWKNTGLKKKTADCLLSCCIKQDDLYFLHMTCINSFVMSENSFREIAGLFRMAPRGHVQTLTPRTWERRRASCRCVRRGKCRSMRMRVLETERTSSPNVNITAYIQPRGASRSNGAFQRLCGTLWS